MSVCKLLPYEKSRWDRWNKRTIERHASHPYYKCANFDMLCKQVQDEKIRNVILEMTDRIIEQINPKKIILFGSYARGEATNDSDIDLLVVINDYDDRYKTASNISMELSPSPYPSDVLTYYTKDIKQMKNSYGFVVRYALEEGVVLYE